MIPRHPIDVHYLSLLHNAEATLSGPESVAVGTGFWGVPSLCLRHEAMPKISGSIHTRMVYANPADAEQSRAILRGTAHNARAARVRARAALAEDETTPVPRPVVCVRYVWIDIHWLRMTLRSLEDLSVPLAAPPDIAFYEMLTLGVWRPEFAYVQACWGVGTPGPFEALTARCDSIWEQMTNLLQSGQPVLPEEAWPMDVAPEYEQPSDGDELCTSRSEAGSA